jgi:polyhydroxybutyrate depolymerase
VPGPISMCDLLPIVRAAFLAGLALLACAAAASADERLAYTHQGAPRAAYLRQPASGAGPRPLVIALHGLNGTGENYHTWSGFDAVADRDGFVTVYPDAIEKRWSYGRPIIAPMPALAGKPVDDIGFIRLLIDDLVGKGIADPARIYVTGSSRGGLMTYTLACALADRIAAAAAIITGMTDLQRDDCRPARPVPIVVIAGTKDTTQPYDGMRFATGRLLSVPDTMEYWRMQHGCTAQSERLLPQRDPAGRSRITLVEWGECQSGARLLLYRVANGGHQLPSTVSGNPMSEEKFGIRNHDIETAEEVWSFFKPYAR